MQDMVAGNLKIANYSHYNNNPATNYFLPHSSSAHCVRILAPFVVRRSHSNTTEAASNCKAVQLQIDTRHLPCRKRMQNSAHNDFDATTSDSRKHSSSASVAIWDGWKTSPAAPVKNWTNYADYLCWRYWKVRADLVSHCPQWNWTRNESEDYKCPALKTSRTQNRQSDRLCRDSPSQKQHQNKDGRAWPCHSARVDVWSRVRHCQDHPRHRCPRCLQVESEIGWKLINLFLFFFLLFLENIFERDFSKLYPRSCAHTCSYALKDRRPYRTSFWKKNYFFTLLFVQRKQPLSSVAKIHLTCMELTATSVSDHQKQ